VDAERARRKSRMVGTPDLQFDLRPTGEQGDVEPPANHRISSRSLSGTSAIVSPLLMLRAPSLLYVPRNSPRPFSFSGIPVGRVFVGYDAAI
jgi:hypothetical protein